MRSVVYIGPSQVPPASMAEELDVSGKQETRVRIEHKFWVMEEIDSDEYVRDLHDCAVP